MAVVRFSFSNTLAVDLTSPFGHPLFVFCGHGQITVYLSFYVTSQSAIRVN